MTAMDEAEVEQAALAWLKESGWDTVYGPDIAPDTDGAERTDYGQVVLERRLHDALERLNPGLPPEAHEDAFRKMTRLVGATPESRNRAFHKMLVDGVTVEYRTADGAIRGAQAQIINFDDRKSSDWLAVNQFTVTENRKQRRPDIVLFVNGLPLGIIELKNPNYSEAIQAAWQQLQTYRDELPSLFAMNEILMVSDGILARVGALTSEMEWFKPWRSIHKETPAGLQMPELQAMLEGVCSPDRLLALVRDFIVFEDDGGAVTKKMAGYHQVHAVQVAVSETLRAADLQQTAGCNTSEHGRYKPGSNPGGPAHWRGVAHAGVRQESHHGLLRRAHRSRAGDGQSHHSCADRPERS